jgi:hypothetical protein
MKEKIITSCTPCDIAGFCVQDGACMDAAYSHGSPELDVDAAKLEALGADPGPTLAELSEVRVLCEACGGEGRIYKSRYGGNDPDVWDAGPCLECNGTAYVYVEAVPVTLEDME